VEYARDSPVASAHHDGALPRMMLRSTLGNYYSRMPSSMLE